MRPVWKEKLEVGAKANAHKSDAAGGEPNDDNGAIPDEPFSTLNSRLSIRLDAYGREIFVEREDANGKPMVWYQYDSKGVKYRRERKGFAVLSEAVAA